MNTDNADYYRYTGKSRLDKAVNTLLGITEGVSIDAKINETEIAFLRNWLEEQKPYRAVHPFNELVPLVSQVLADGVLAGEELADILWLCERLRSTQYYDMTTADVQRLHAILGSIACDNIITEEELKGLSDWLSNHEHLRRCWPYDEVDGVVTSVLADRRIDEKEQEFLRAFFSEFVAPGGENHNVAQTPVSTGATMQGICAACPQITFYDSLFCFTGESRKYTRKQFAEVVVTLGGRVSHSVTASLDYLVVGADGNPCWAYACYGRKIEKAVALRRDGQRLIIVHENDFHDAVADVNRS